jgi:hypothetical protein
VLVGSVSAVVVEAQRGRRGRRARTVQPQVVETPQSDAIAPALGGLEWGMSRTALLKRLRDGLEAEWLPRVHKAPGAIEEDRLRHEMQGLIRQLHENQVEFDGSRTGWDVSFVRDEYTQGNQESMLVTTDGQSQNFYFFIRDRLWKWYRAFNADVFEGQDFGTFSTALQGRFGEGRTQSGALHEGGDTRQWIEWQDDTTRLRAVDETQFFGFYCLVFEDRRTLANLATLRPNPDPRNRAQATNSLIDSVTQPETSGGRNQDIVDRITGNIRRRTDAEEDDESGSDSNRRGNSNSNSSSSSSRSSAERDPLEGL